MARVHHVKSSRKEYKCSKCGCTIPVGSPYVYGNVFRRRTPVRRCLKCGLKFYELSTSDYTRSIGAIVEDWEQDYGIEDGVWTAIADALQEVLDGTQESFDNIPYQLQDGDTGNLLQERMEQLEQAIQELDFDMENLLSEALGGLDTEEQEAIYALQDGRALREVYEGLTGEEDDSALSHWKEETESVIAQHVDEVLGELSY